MVDAGPVGERHRRADHVGLGCRRSLGHIRGLFRPHATLKRRARMKLPTQSWLKVPAQGWLHRWAPLLGLLIVIGIAFDVLTRSRLSATTGMMCEGEYADSLQIGSLRTREIEQGPRSQFSYLVRSSAKYECPF